MRIIARRWLNGLLLGLFCGVVGFAHAQTDLILALAWQPNGTIIAQGYASGSIRLIQAATGTLLYQWTAHQRPVNDLSWTSDGRYLASASSDTTLKIWHITPQPLQATLFNTLHHPDQVLNVAWRWDNNRLLAIVTAGEGNEGYLWQVDWQQTNWSFVSDPVGNGMAPVWQPNQPVIAFANYDEAFFANDSDLITFHWISNPEPGNLYLNIYRVAWQPNADRLATGHAKGLARLWDLATNTLLHTLQANDSQARVLAVQFAPDGRALYSFSADGTLRGWATDTGALISTQHLSGGPFTTVAWSTDLSQLAASGETEAALAMLATSIASPPSPAPECD